MPLMILTMAAPPFLAAIAVLKSGAPRRPTRAGAIAGLLAGGIATTLYTLSCPFDEPAFVAVWYELAIFLLAIVGAMIGRRLLAW